VPRQRIFSLKTLRWIKLSDIISGFIAIFFIDVIWFITIALVYLAFILQMKFTSKISRFNSIDMKIPEIKSVYLLTVKYNVPGKTLKNPSKCADDIK
jgi:hypothetical protein